MPRGVQATVNTLPAPAVAGDFASANPRFTALAGPGAFVAGSGGVIIGNFCWASSQSFDPNSAPQVVNSFGSGPVLGFVGRHQQAIITTFLADASMVISPGLMTTVYSGGDFWALNSGTQFAEINMKAYANLLTGAVTFAATGAATGVTAATSSVAASAFSVTGSVTGNILTVTAVGSGTVVAGSTISGTNVTSGSMVMQQLTPLLSGETAGGVGRYALNYGEQAAASTTISGTYGTLTVGAVPSGTIVLGALVTGSGTVAGTYLTQLLTGTGGNGSTFAVTNATVVGSATLTFSTNVETKWIAMSQGVTGNIIKISDHPLG